MKGSDLMTDRRGTDLLAKQLIEARSIELGLVRTLEAHIAMTPGGTYRLGLERHLRETRDHAKRVERRAKELGYGRSAAERSVAALQGLASQLSAVTKAPIDIVRGSGGDEKLLRNARDESTSEAF
jgi:hypothetical protein